MNAKDFALDKVKEIIQVCNDLQYVENKQLRIKGIMQIEKLASGIEDHLEYLELIKENYEEEE